MVWLTALGLLHVLASLLVTVLVCLLAGMILGLLFLLGLAALFGRK